MRSGAPVAGSRSTTAPALDTQAQPSAGGRRRTRNSATKRVCAPSFMLRNAVLQDVARSSGWTCAKPVLQGEAARRRSDRTLSPGQPTRAPSSRTTSYSQVAMFARLHRQAEPRFPLGQRLLGLAAAVDVLDHADPLGDALAGPPRDRHAAAAHPAPAAGAADRCGRGTRSPPAARPRAPPDHAATVAARSSGMDGRQPAVAVDLFLALAGQRAPAMAFQRRALGVAAPHDQGAGFGQRTEAVLARRQPGGGAVARRRRFRHRPAQFVRFPQQGRGEPRFSPGGLAQLPAGSGGRGPRPARPPIIRKAPASATTWSTAPPSGA